MGNKIIFKENKNRIINIEILVFSILINLGLYFLIIHFNKNYNLFISVLGVFITIRLLYFLFYRYIIAQKIIIIGFSFILGSLGFIVGSWFGNTFFILPIGFSYFFFFSGIKLNLEQINFESEAELVEYRNDN